MTRVLQVTGNKPLGGVKTFLVNYQKYIEVTDVLFDYLFFEDEYAQDDFDSFLKTKNSSIYVVPALRIKNYLKIIKQLDLFFNIHRNNYDVIHIHTPNILFLIYPFVKKYSLKNVVLHSHATMYSDKKLNALRNRLLCMNVCDRIDYAVACSSEAGRFLFKDKSFLVFNNAIDCSRFLYDEDRRNKIREVLKIKGRIVLCHAGIFNKQKNHSFLLKVFKYCHDRDSRFVLLLLGEGPLKNAIEKLVEKEGLSDSVFFLGQIKNVEDYFSASDAFILPSLFEGFPLVGIEAQANGLPCVFSDVITKEASIGFCKYVALNKSCEDWYETISSALKYNNNRVVQNKTVKDAGFDITVESKKLRDFYLDVSGGGDEVNER